MGTAAQHRVKAERNAAFLGTISDDYPEWLSTVAFYTAVEYLELLFAERDIHSKSHEDRKRFVRQNFQSIQKPYNALYNASLNARYQAEDNWLSPGEVWNELITRRLHHVRTYVLSHSDFCKQQAVQLVPIERSGRPTDST